MYQQFKELNARVNDLYTKYGHLGGEKPQQNKRSIVKHRVVSGIVETIKNHKSTTQINSDDINFVVLNKNALNYMKGVLKIKDPTEKQLSDGAEYGREIIKQLNANIQALKFAILELPQQQQKEVYDNIFKVLDVVEKMEKIAKPNPKKILDWAKEGGDKSTKEISAAGAKKASTIQTPPGSPKREKAKKIFKTANQPTKPPKTEPLHRQ